MATESPIRMLEARGKWASHNGGIVPNRSGSAPPNMEGSLAAIENPMHNSILNATSTSLSYDWDSRGPGRQLVSHLSPAMNYSLAIELNPKSHQSVMSGTDQHLALNNGRGQLRLASFRSSSDNFFQLSQCFLPTHKESEDDRSPQKSFDDVADTKPAVRSGQDSSSSLDQARVVSDFRKDEHTRMSSPSNEKSNAVQKEDTSPSSSENRTSVSGDPDVTSLQSRIKALKVSCPPNLDHHKDRGERRHGSQGISLPHQVVHRSGNFQFQGSVPQVASGTNNSHVVGSQYFHGGRFPSPEVQPVLHSSGFTPPLYAQPPGVLYPSQYGVGGYPYNPNIPPFYMAGYPSHTSIPLAFDGVTAGSDVNTQFYGQPGFAPPFVDPRVQFHQSFGDLYNVSGQVDPLTSRGGDIGNQVGAFDTHVRPNFDHRPQHQGLNVQSNVSQRRGSIGIPDYSGNSVSMGFYMPVPNSPISPIGVNGLFGGSSEVNSPNSGRSVGFYAGWQGQRGFDNFNDQKPYSFLGELKSGKGRRFELSDIVGHVVEFSVDQHGSRFIQQKLEYCSVEDKASVFQEVVPHACKLMTDVFGNYVIQKFFEYGTPDQRRDLAKALTGQILSLSLQMYGCRVIQKALDVIELDQKIELARELDGQVTRCVRDQNGNHVIQKCIECIPSERIGFVISAFRGQIASLSMHPYGCRVIQRVLEHSTDELQSQFIVDEILESVCTLAQDQYGNYVAQHVLEKGKPQERTQIIKNLCGQVVKMSQHKFASNVVEKCLEYGDAPSRELIISEVVGQTEGNDNLLVMMKDQYANYVVQKILEKCAESQREQLIVRIREHLDALKKYTYGKHIVARFEQLFGEISGSAS